MLYFFHLKPAHPSGWSERVVYTHIYIHMFWGLPRELLSWQVPTIPKKQVPLKRNVWLVRFSLSEELNLARGGLEDAPVKTWGYWEDIEDGWWTSRRVKLPQIPEIVSIRGLWKEAHTFSCEMRKKGPSRCFIFLTPPRINMSAEGTISKGKKSSNHQFSGDIR